MEKVVRKAVVNSMNARGTEFCCAILRIKEESALHKALVRAILQVTGYGKKFVQEAGMVEPRGADNNFTPEFKAIVSNFLETKKGGVVFFPIVIPNYLGWAESYGPGDRLVWKSGSRRDLPPDKIQIEQGKQLLFEDVKNGPTALKVDEAEVIESFAGTRCEKCGSDDDEVGNEIILCGNCDIPSHQICSKIFPIPQGEWYCDPCRLMRDTIARKHPRAEVEMSPTPLPRVKKSKGRADVTSTRAELTEYQIKNTALYVRIEEAGGKLDTIGGQATKIYRSLGLSSVTSMADLLRKVLRVWDMEDRSPRILAKIPSSLDGYTEFVGSDNAAGCPDMFQMIKNEWANVTDATGHIDIHIVLLLLE
ncbi:hypothetical protein LZ554_000639 [Drepanopeziza brunnea f. sp. 'monogermtubi']|nr:hypothetical protein LZ554_000639 [Drepanopeziza brunnea f. sp. 'monogermtubi']